MTEIDPSRRRAVQLAKEKLDHKRTMPTREKGPKQPNYQNREPNESAPCSGKRAYRGKVHHHHTPEAPSAAATSARAARPLSRRLTGSAKPIRVICDDGLWPLYAEPPLTGSKIPGPRWATRMGLQSHPWAWMGSDAGTAALGLKRARRPSAGSREQSRRR